MPDPNVVDRLGVYVIVALLAGTALYAAWLLLMRAARGKSGPER